ncbi:hypothetical protein J4E91_001128 [Alternaria rosae]|nr:hypothetical protein J4E91_001128 [Alternaria rosae]
MTTIISYTIELLPQKGVSNPQLTPEAEALLASDPKKFTERYGQYFVSGQQCRSTFIAVCSQSASSKEQLDEFKAKIGVNYEIGGLEAAAEYMKRVKSSNLSIKTDIIILGYNPKKDLKHFSTMETNFMPILRQFRQNYTPVPYLALLTDYSYIDCRAPIQNERFTLPPDLDGAFQKVCILEARAQSCLMEGARRMLPEIPKLHKEIASIYFSDPDWQGRLAEVEDDLEKSQEQVNEWFRRQALLSQAMKLSAKRWPSKKWFKAQDTTVWKTGLSHIDCCKSLASEVRHDIRKFPEYSHDGKSLNHSYEDRIIVGVRVVCYGDNKDGRWRLKEGWIGDSALGVEFKIECRKLAVFIDNNKFDINLQKKKIQNSFTVEVWSLDRDLYAQ